MYLSLPFEPVRSLPLFLSMHSTSSFCQMGNNYVMIRTYLIRFVRFSLELTYFNFIFIAVISCSVRFFRRFPLLLNMFCKRFGWYARYKKSTHDWVCRKIANIFSQMNDTKWYLEICYNSKILAIKCHIRKRNVHIHFRCTFRLYCIIEVDK